MHSDEDEETEVESEEEAEAGAVEAEEAEAEAASPSLGPASPTAEAAEAEAEAGHGGDAASRVPLPTALRSFENGQLRKLLSAAGVAHQQCTTRHQLLDRLRHVAARADAGGGVSLAVLIERNGWGGAARSGSGASGGAGGKRRAGGGGRERGPGAATGRAAPRAAGPAGAAGARSAAERAEGQGASEGEDADSVLAEEEAEEEARQRAAADPNLAWWQLDDPYTVALLRRMRRQLLRKLDALRWPDNPLDELLARLGGPSKVAEMTGRKGRVLRDARGGPARYEQRTRSLQADRAIYSYPLPLPSPLTLPSPLPLPYPYPYP